MLESDIKTLRKELPYVYVYDQKDLIDFSATLVTGYKTFLDEIIKLIKDNDINVMVIDPHPVSFFMFQSI